MTVSTDKNNTFDDDASGNRPTEYQYDLRLEIGVKESTDSVPVVAIFHDLIKTMKSAVDENKPLVVLTATDQLFFEHKEMSSEEFQRAFHVESLEGKVPKVLLGFKLRSMTKLYDIKQRILKDYLQSHNLFIREHVGGFHEGIKTYTFGFLKDDHPDHPDIPAQQARFNTWMTDAWKKMEKDEKKKWNDEFPNLFYGSGGIALPINFVKDRVSAEVEGRPKISTMALMVTTPAKYGYLMRDLLDIAITGKKINNLIPLAFYREDPKGYYDIVTNQDRFMSNHRNIPIANIPFNAQTMKGIKGSTLLDILHGNKNIQRVSHDHKQGKYHVSTTADKYYDVHTWITKALGEHTFPFNPSIRPLKYNPNHKTTYSSVMTAAMSVTNESYDASTIKTNRSTAWKQRPPLNISYVLDAAAFPELPKHSSKIPVTPSMTSEIFDEDTLQSAISAALTKMEAQHKAELEAMKSDMDAKIKMLESQMKTLGEQVAVQTYHALVKEDSPLVTKMDHAQLKHDINALSTQMTTLIQMFQSTKPTDHVSPPRYSKRVKPSTPVKTNLHETFFTQESDVSSAASVPEEDTEGCED